MPTERPLHGRYSVGRSLRSAAQVWGFRTLSLRETAWFYSVGLLTAAVLMWSPSRAASPQPAPSPVDTPERRELSSGALQELPQMVRGLTEADPTGGAGPLGVTSRRTIPHLRVGQNSRSRQKPVGRATIFDRRSAARLAAGADAQALGDEGIKTPLLRGDESVTAARGQRSSPTRQPENPRRRR